ncbi:MAG TPA: glycosyltransferase [Thermoplasmata archaeon]|nr:glycosyltransferase [Thermoplasmata archaeon]
MSSTRPEGISVVIPAYNEELRIGSSIASYVPVLESTGLPYEIIVVVDGDDRTQEVAESIGCAQIRFLRSPQRLGKGGAILAGFRGARFATVGYVDADGSLRPSDLLVLIRSLEYADLTIGSRWLPDSHWLKKEPRLNRVASRGYNVLVRSVLNLQVTDTQCGAKFYRADLLAELLDRVQVTNMSFDTAMIFHAQRLGARIVEVPIAWTHDDRSKFSVEREVFVMLLTLVGIRLMNLPMGRWVPPSFIDSFMRRYGNQ